MFAATFSAVIEAASVRRWTRPLVFLESQWSLIAGPASAVGATSGYFPLVIMVFGSCSVFCVDGIPSMALVVLGLWNYSDMPAAGDRSDRRCSPRSLILDS